MNPHYSVFQSALEFAKLAQDQCRKSSGTQLQMERKADKTWVTQADQNIEIMLRDLINKRYPSHAILGEEQGGSLDDSKGQYTWVLDPIDGTFSFVHNIPFYSSLIAVFYEGKPVIGVASIPEQNIEMSALKDYGAFINGVPYVKPKISEELELFSTADPYRFHMAGCPEIFTNLVSPPRKLRTYPDALGYYFLLRGSVRAFVDPKVELWDVAPFHVILPEAGFAIHPWNQSEGLQAGSSVAHALTTAQTPHNVDDILEILRKSSHS